MGLAKIHATAASKAFKCNIHNLHIWDDRPVSILSAGSVGNKRIRTENTVEVKVTID